MRIITKPNGRSNNKRKKKRMVFFVGYGPPVPVVNVASQYAYDVVLTSVRRRFNVMDVVWTSKRRSVLTGIGEVPTSDHKNE